MDNSNYGADMAADIQHRKSQDQEKRIQDLEDRLAAMEAQVHRLTMLAKHHIERIGTLQNQVDGIKATILDAQKEQIERAMESARKRFEVL